MNKTKPIGVRFNISDLDFVMKREKLTTAQQVVYFLIKEYCKLYRVSDGVSVFEVKEKSTIQVENKSTSFVKSYAYYKSLLDQCKSEDDYYDVLEDIGNSNLTISEKRSLTQKK